MSPFQYQKEEEDLISRNLSMEKAPTEICTTTIPLFTLLFLVTFHTAHLPHLSTYLVFSLKREVFKVVTWAISGSYFSWVSPLYKKAAKLFFSVNLSYYKGVSKGREKVVSPPLCNWNYIKYFSCVLLLFYFHEYFYNYKSFDS